MYTWLCHHHLHVFQLDSEVVVVVSKLVLILKKYTTFVCMYIHSTNTLATENVIICND